MAKDPAFLFYSGDFLAGTFTMTNEEVGAYVKLLCLQHGKSYVTDKDFKSICINDNVESTVKGKFIIDKNTGFYYNERLKEESEKRRAYSESRKANRKGKKIQDIKIFMADMLKICKSYDAHMENVNEIINSISEDKELCVLYLSDISTFTDKMKHKVLEFIPDFDFSNEKIYADSSLKICDFESEKAKQLLLVEGQKFIELAIESGYPLSNLILIIAKRINKKNELVYFDTQIEINAARKVANTLIEKHKSIEKSLDVMIDKFLVMSKDDFWKTKMNFKTIAGNINQIFNLK